MNTNINAFRGLVTILAGSAMTCVFCAAQALSPVRNLRAVLLLQQDQTEKQQQPTGNEKKDEGDEKKGEKSAPPVRGTSDQPGGSIGSPTSTTNSACETPGGSAGGGTFKLSGTVTSDGDAIVLANNKTCAVKNPEALKGHEGRKVKVKARLAGAAKNAIVVTRVLGPKKADNSMTNEMGSQN